MTAEPHAAVTPLLGLLGTWRGEGAGDYPTIEPFDYRETVTFDHDGRPFLTYEQHTERPDGSAPLHREYGYLRALGHGRAELAVAQPTGIVEVHDGTVVDDVVELASVAVAATPAAKPVRSVRRRFELRADTLVVDLWMAYRDVPETHHLHAELRRSTRRTERIR